MPSPWSKPAVSDHVHRIFVQLGKMRTSSIWPFTILVFLHATGSNAQFGNIFEQMFGAQGGHPGQQQHRRQEYSPGEWYASNFDDIANDCDKFLCLNTLSCVAGPEDCPCRFPAVEEKCPTSQGDFVCVSRTPGMKPCAAVDAALG